MNDPYRLLGVSSNSTDSEIKNAYKNLIRDYAGNDERISKITEAYDYIMNSRRGGYEQNSSSEFIEVRHQIQTGNYDTAEAMLNSMNNNCAEWYFLKGSVFYGKGWLDEAYNNFSQAVRLEPDNAEYSSAMRHMSESQNGQMNGNSTMSGNPMNNVGGCGLCNICQGLICADCCCECVGCDCIPCC